MDICSKNDISFITMTNKGYIDFTLNCYKSLEKCGADFSLVSHALDNDAFNLLIKNKKPATLVDEKKLSDLVCYNREGWGTMMYTKMKIIYNELQKHKYVCITDGDIVFNDKKFMEYCFKMSADYDILFQNNSNSVKNKCICAGFVFIKSNENTKKLYNINEITKVRTEQSCLRGRIKKNPNLKLGYLPLILFPNGKFYRSNNKKIKNPYMIHFNHTSTTRKIGHMKKYGSWYLKDYNTGFDINKTKKHIIVTSICSKLIKNNTLEIKEKNYNNHFTDIMPGKRKYLFVEYVNTDGKDSEVIIDEKKLLKINCKNIQNAIYFIK